MVLKDKEKVRIDFWSQYHFKKFLAKGKHLTLTTTRYTIANWNNNSKFCNR